MPWRRKKISCLCTNPKKLILKKSVRKKYLFNRLRKRISPFQRILNSKTNRELKNPTYPNQYQRKNQSKKHYKNRGKNRSNNNPQKKSKSKILTQQSDQTNKKANKNLSYLQKFNKRSKNLHQQLLLVSIMQSLIILNPLAKKAEQEPR